MNPTSDSTTGRHVAHRGLNPFIRSRDFPVRRVLALLALVVIVYVLGCAWGWNRALGQFTLDAAPDTGAPEDTVSRRFFLDTDAYYWIAFARDMAENGTWRVRWTDVDNPPEGRPVYWSQSVPWMLLAFGSAHRLLTGASIGHGIEAASIWLHPFLLILFTLITTWLILRNMGLLPALLWMLFATTLHDLYAFFHPFRPDHHSFQIAFAFGHLFFLTLGGLGWVAASATRGTKESSSTLANSPVPPAGKKARLFFVAAGISGGLGLWTGATVTLFCGGAVVAGVALMFWLMPSGKRDESSDADAVEYRPTLWRIWGYAGGLTALCFYLLEFFPFHMGMRLEVNHPLYAIAWMGLGEIFYRVSAWRIRGHTLSGGDWTVLFIACVAVAILPLSLLLGPESWHAMRNAQMRRLHDFILEFQRFEYLGTGYLFRHLFFHYGVLLVSVPLAVWLADPKRIRPREWAALWVALFSCILFFFLMLWQIRWSGFFALFLAWLTVITVAMAWTRARTNRMQKYAYAVLCILLFAQPVHLGGRHIMHIRQIHDGEALTSEVIMPFYHRGLADALGRQKGEREWQFLCSDPTLAGPLHYFGEIPSVASYYWENLDGLQAAIAFFTDSADGREAYRIAKERRWTHVFIPDSEKAVHDFYYIRYGRYDEAGMAMTLAGSIHRDSQAVPPWLVPDTQLQAIAEAPWSFRGRPLQTPEILVYQIDLSRAP